MACLTILVSAHALNQIQHQRESKIQLDIDEEDNPSEDDESESASEFVSSGFVWLYSFLLECVIAYNRVKLKSIKTLRMKSSQKIGMHSGPVL